jgi:hypothetical protein
VAQKSFIFARVCESAHNHNQVFLPLSQKMVFSRATVSLADFLPEKMVFQPILV